MAYPHGYAEFLRVLLDPDNDERDEQKRLKVWSGGKFHPMTFDLSRANKAVRSARRRYQDPK